MSTLVLPPHLHPLLPPPSLEKSPRGEAKQGLAAELYALDPDLWVVRRLHQGS